MFGSPYPSCRLRGSSEFPHLDEASQPPDPRTSTVRNGAATSTTGGTGPANRAWARVAARLDAEDLIGEVTAAWAVARTHGRSHRRRPATGRAPAEA